MASNPKSHTVLATPQLRLFEHEHDKPQAFETQTGNWADDFGRQMRDGVKFERTPRVLGLFSGAGGLDIGFHDCGFEIVETVEFERKFVDTLDANTGEGRYLGACQRNVCVDIREYVPEIGEVDFIIGGPPCQSFSAAGARASGVAGTRDERGSLFREYVRLLRLLRPKGFLFENVYRIVGANGGKDWQEITQAFLEAGYNISSRILDAADYGVAQHRERLIIVGVRNDLIGEIEYRFPRPTHGPDALTGLPHVSAGAVLADMPPVRSNIGLSGRYGHLLDEIPPGLNYSYFTERMGHPRPIFAWRSKFSDFLYKADPARPVRTIKASGGQYTGPFHWENRVFSVDELKRLQSFPDSYELSGKRGTQVKQIGNSVPPQFARILALSVADRIFSASLPMHLPYLSVNEVLSFRNKKSELTAHYEHSAQRAISLLERGNAEVKISSYCGHLSSDFSWKDGHGSGGNFLVSERISGTELYIDLTKNGEADDGHLWSFYLTPKIDWLLPYTGVRISSSFGDLQSYTACWKAFECFIIRNQIKADLVQLFNYYQYEPSVSIEPRHVPNGPTAKMIANLSRGHFVNSILTLQDVARGCGISIERALEVLLDLKTAGFEVRSGKTNAAISDGSYLIPYGFPTLTRMSVQRTKELV
jgi:DNA (cytosine-5)-methyltransferase 1